MFSGHDEHEELVKEQQDKEDMSEIVSEQIEIFCNQLEADGISSVTLRTVRTKWVPKIAHLEATKTNLLDALEDARTHLVHTTGWECECIEIPETPFVTCVQCQIKQAIEKPDPND